MRFGIQFRFTYFLSEPLFRRFVLFQLDPLRSRLRIFGFGFFRLSGDDHGNSFGKSVGGQSEPQILAADVYDNSLGAVINISSFVHGYILVQVLVNIWVRSFLSILSSRSVIVDSGLFALIETFFLLQTEREDLIIAFEKVAKIRLC